MRQRTPTTDMSDRPTAPVPTSERGTWSSRLRRSLRSPFGHSSPQPLPGQPPRDQRVGAAPDPALGPVPKSTGSQDPKIVARAVCCSGGGIRAAAFSFGGLQYLNEHTYRNGTVYAQADFVTSVSGGGYMASSYALVSHQLGNARPPDPPVYSPGSPEDTRLRVHTRYLVDSKTELGISLLGILYGLTMNLLPILSIVFIAAAANAALVAKGTKSLSRVRSGGTKYQWAVHVTNHMGWVALGPALAALGVYTVYWLVDLHRRPPLGDVGTKRFCVPVLILLGIAAALAVAGFAVPWALQELSRVNKSIAHPGTLAQTGSFAGTVSVLAVLVGRVLRTYEPKPGAGSGGSLVNAALTSAKPRLVRIGDTLLPWLGTFIIVIALAIAYLTWVSDWASALWRGDPPLWIGLGVAVAIWAGWSVIANSNRTSLHSYYTKRLASAFAVPRGGDGPAAEADLTFSNYAHDPVGPPLVLCATANIDKPGLTPTGRNCAPFTFSPYYSGLSSGVMFGAKTETTFDLKHRESQDPGRHQWVQQYREIPGVSDKAALMVPTSELETAAGGLSLPDMAAVSGAALSPAMGRSTRPALRLLFGVANVRLGMWLPNPLRPTPARPRASTDTRPPAADPDRPKDTRPKPNPLRRPGLWCLLREIVGGISFTGYLIYVTDGGHYDNEGLVEALRRGATRVIVFDGCNDKPFSLSTLGNAIETARADLGVDIVMDQPTALLEVGTTGMAHALSAAATATYPNGVTARILVCKAAMCAGLPQDIIAWHAAHPNYPNDSTGQQLYGDREFEAYRKLGYLAAQDACHNPSGWIHADTSTAGAR